VQVVQLALEIVEPSVQLLDRPAQGDDAGVVARFG
jgi:hypothetical protein